MLALVIMPDSGWFTSCAIDAVNTPRLVTLVTWARSDRAWAECLFGEPALGYVLNRTDNLGPAIAVPGPMGDRAHVLE